MPDDPDLSAAADALAGAFAAAYTTAMITDIEDYLTAAAQPGGRGHIFYRWLTLQKRRRTQ